MTETKQILQQIKESVHATDPSATVILYGSYARGEQHEESDIDILVLLDKEKVDYDDQKRIGRPIYHIEVEEGIIISPKIYARKVWETKVRITQFYKNVIKDGIIL